MSKSRAKGTSFESAVVTFLIEHGFPYAERRAMQGKNDRGDIAGVPGFVLECKATARIDLGEFVTETETERKNAGARYGATVIKRRGKSIGDAYVAVPLSQFVELIR